MNALVTNKSLTKIVLFSWEVIYSTDDFVKVAQEVQRSQSVYLTWVSKLITVSAIKLVEMASPIEKFEYYDLNNLPMKIKNLMKDKISQSRENGTYDKITPDTLSGWIVSIREHLKMYEERLEDIQDMSPEAVAKRKQMISEMRERIARKMGK